LKRMRPMRGLRFLVGVLAALTAEAGGAHAATISDCITIDPVALSQAYNPFTTSTSVQTINVTVRSVTAADPTTKADFVFVQPQNDPTPYQITYGAASVLYPFPGPTLSTTGPNPNTITADFGLHGQHPTQVFTILFTMPAGANIPAGTFVIPFGIDAVCRFAGSHDATTGTLVDPFNISLTVRSALQAYFAGPPLDFGAITNVTAPMAPSHSVNGYIHVSSSGPYSVGVSSGNGFRMTFPGGNLGTANQRVGYRLSFMGQMSDFAAPAFTTVNCHFTGISGNDLAIAATLEDGGAGKTPAPNYQDILTVTVTPLAVPPGDVYPACS
jgi:hypothetical protein